MKGKPLFCWSQNFVGNLEALAYLMAISEARNNIFG
jgi:hypothetical protein